MSFDYRARAEVVGVHASIDPSRKLQCVDHLEGSVRSTHQRAVIVVSGERQTGANNEERRMSALRPETGWRLIETLLKD